MDEGPCVIAQLAIDARLLFFCIQSTKMLENGVMIKCSGELLTIPRVSIEDDETPPDNPDEMEHQEEVVEDTRMVEFANANENTGTISSCKLCSDAFVAIGTWNNFRACMSASCLSFLGSVPEGTIVVLRFVGTILPNGTPDVSKYFITYAVDKNHKLPASCKFSILAEECETDHPLPLYPRVISTVRLEPFLKLITSIRTSYISVTTGAEKKQSQTPIGTSVGLKLIFQRLKDDPSSCKQIVIHADNHFIDLNMHVFDNSSEDPSGNLFSDIQSNLSSSVAISFRSEYLMSVLPLIKKLLPQTKSIFLTCAHSEIPEYISLKCYIYNKDCGGDRPVGEYFFLFGCDVIEAGEETIVHDFDPQSNEQDDMEENDTFDDGRHEMDENPTSSINSSCFNQEAHMDLEFIKKNIKQQPVASTASTRGRSQTNTAKKPSQKRKSSKQQPSSKDTTTIPSPTPPQQDENEHSIPLVVDLDMDSSSPRDGVHLHSGGNGSVVDSRDIPDDPNSFPSSSSEEYGLDVLHVRNEELAQLLYGIPTSQSSSSPSDATNTKSQQQSIKKESSKKATPKSSSSSSSNSKRTSSSKKRSREDLSDGVVPVESVQRPRKRSRKSSTTDHGGGEEDVTSSSSVGETSTNRPSSKLLKQKSKISSKTEPMDEDVPPSSRRKSSSSERQQSPQGRKAILEHYYQEQRAMAEAAERSDRMRIKREKTRNDDDDHDHERSSSSMVVVVDTKASTEDKQQELSLKRSSRIRDSRQVRSRKKVPRLKRIKKEPPSIDEDDVQPHQENNSSSQERRDFLAEQGRVNEMDNPPISHAKHTSRKLHRKQPHS